MTDDSTIAPATQTYVLALEDEYDPDCNTIHTFTDPEIRQWINEVLTFTPDEHKMRVAIPGTEYSTTVTTGSYRNDKAQALLNTSSGPGGVAHPSLTAVDFPDGEYDETFKRLMDKVGTENVYVGAWY